MSHHPHVHSHADGHKSWKSYFSEFVMLFLAVTLGFFVENFREHFVERNRERVVMRQVLEDLRTDRLRADSNLVLRRWRAAKMDSLLAVQAGGAPSSHAAEVYYFGQMVRNRYLFQPSTGAFVQLESGGGLRLVDNVEVIRAVQKYQFAVEQLLSMQALEEDQIQRYRNGPLLRLLNPSIVRRITHQDIEALDKRVDRPASTARLLTTDPILLNEFFMLVANMESFNKTATRLVTGLAMTADSVAALINRTYHFETPD